MPANPWHTSNTTDTHEARAVTGRWLLLPALMLVLAGCSTTTRIEPYKETRAVISGTQQVVILARRNHANHEAEPGFVNCVGKELGEGKHPIRVQPTQAFVDGLYPWFEPATAPLTTEALTALLKKPKVRSAISKTGVRFLVWIDGSTARVSSGGGVSCAAGIGGAGCMGLAWWEDDSRYDATIWDLSALAKATGTIHADVKGRSIMPALVIPIPLIARPKIKACHSLADQLQKFLTTPGGYGAGPETTARATS